MQNQFVAGYENGILGPSARLWKNGNELSLAINGEASVANEVVVNGTDVYVAGTETFTSNVSYAVVWKNGIIDRLTDGLDPAGANAVIVKGTDVYAAGYEEEFNGSGIVKPVVWKKGGTVPGLSGVSDFITKALFLKGSDFYAAGELENNGTGTVCLYKNDSLMYTYGVGAFIYPKPAAKDVLIFGNDVYYAGKEKGPILLKNQQRQGLELNNKEGAVNAIFIK